MDTTTKQFLVDGDTMLDALELADVGIWRWPVGSDTLEWTRNLERMHQLPQGAFDGTFESFTADIHPDDRAAVWAAIRATAETGAPYEVRYRTPPISNREAAWISAKGGRVTQDGTTYLTGICRNVTSEVQAEEELRKRLRHLAGITELGSFALGEDDFNKVLDCAVDLAAEMFDASLTKILQFGDAASDLCLRAGHGWPEGLVGQARVGIDLDSQAGYTLHVREPVVVRDLRTETRFSGPSLLVEHGVISGMSVVIEGTDGRAFGVFGVHDTRLRDFDDVDARSLRSLANVVANAARNDQAMKRQKLLTREIAHRANNLLQIVSVIAKQTMASGADPAAASAAFRKRLVAISRANDLISQGGWAPSRIRAVTEEVLRPYREHLTLTGRDILLPPQLCFDIALVLHELATNSIKYGSLGVEGGMVSIDWSVTRDAQGQAQFELEWTDREPQGGAGQGSGFGRKLKSMLIEDKWSGTITVEQKDGYRFACSIPLAEPVPE